MKYSWQQFRIALGLLTILAVDHRVQATPERLGRSLSLFPAVGVLLGLFLVVFNSLLDAFVPRALLDCVLLLSMIILSGRLPLDGIANLLENLVGGKFREGRLRIIKDSRVGVMGGVGLMILLLLKYLCLFNLPLEVKSAGLIFMPVAGGWVQVVLAVSCRNLHVSERAGAVSLEHAGERELLIASGSLILVALVLFGLQGIFLIFLLGIAAIVLIKFFEMRLGGVAGDVLGASSEVLQAVSLLLVLAVI